MEFYENDIGASLVASVKGMVNKETKSLINKSTIKTLYMPIKFEQFPRFPCLP